MSLEQVQELMERAYALPYGEARTVLTEEALRRAEETGDAALTFQVRMELGSAYQFGGEPIKTFTTFSRCLAEYDADPAGLGPSAEHRLLWQFKWIAYSLTQFPEVPLDRTRSVLDDMERRYKAGGHSLQAVYGRRTRIAQHLGNDGAADRWFALWHTTPRDELSDCAGCDPSGKASYLGWRGRDDEALAVSEPVLREELNCAEQPQSILSSLLPVFLRTGRLEEARNAHLRAYRLMRARLNELGYIGDHVEFCARTGNEARGLEIVQRHLGWLDRAPSPYADMRFSAAAALLLRRVEEAGHGELAIARPGGDGEAPDAAEPAGPAEVAVGDLRAELTTRALELAARFDARNGNEHQSGLVRALLEAEPLVDHLPLTQYDRHPVSVAVPAPAPEEIPGHADVDDLDALLDIGEEEWSAGRIDRAGAAWRRFDELAGDASLTVAQRARRVDGRGVERFAEDDPDAALADWLRAAELYEEAGDEVARHAALGRAGTIHCGQGRLDEGFALLRDAVAYLDEHAAGTKRAFAARMRLAGALLNAERPQEALTALDGLVPATPGDTGDLALMRARLMYALGDADAAAPALEEARAALRESGDMAPLAEASLMLGTLLAHRGHRTPEGEEILNEALAVLDEAVSSARATADPRLTAITHAERGTLLLSLDRPVDSVPDSVEAVAAFTALGATVQAAYARLDLANGYYATGRHLEAAETAEEAVAILSRLDDPDAHRRGRLLLAHAQAELGEEQAADLFTELSGEQGEDTASAARLLEMAGEVLTRLDKDGLAAERFETAADTFAAAGDPYGVVRTRRQAGLCRLWSRRPEEGLAQMERARAALADLPAANPAAITWETGRVSYDEARLLAEVGRLDEALERVDAAIAAFGELDEKDAAETATRLRGEIESALA
ncbi:hypothetical protein GCM10023085_75420 [Actinomadura viridis]|uniref:Tetratricopeptide (TPR) repeat protein n=1 Tax=Actinomadura viridis TaxID=58110 RepID=A0A931DCY4_9ACTN|nr:hypothetical protein [Actinomadura viridis]MBG6086574.1 tetratricopeptide (TPR) repeat protein [Actinomadura viridis]